MITRENFLKKSTFLTHARNILRAPKLAILAGLFALFTALFATAPSAFAGGYLNSAKLTYGDETVDVYASAYTISLDDQKDLLFAFDLAPEATYATLYNIDESGARAPLCQTSGKTCAVSYSSLKSDTGLQIEIVKENEIVEQTMLGVIIKQNVAKESYEGLDVSVGPSSGITIDMSSVLSGMSFNINPVPLPIRYQKFSDGRSVLGIGTNAFDVQFWEDAKKDDMKERISKGDLYTKWEEEHKYQGDGGGLGLLWTVTGYATAYSNNPNKMSGTIQFYVGSGYNYTGQYAILTFSVTVTIGVDGEFTFTLEPKKASPLSASLDLGISAGLTVYGGIGIGNLASAGIYGAANFNVGATVLPSFNLHTLSLSGEVGFKVKLLGRDAFTYTITSGTHDFLKKVNEDGSVTYRTEADFNTALGEYLEELVASGYGEQIAAEVKAPEGETTWDLENLDLPTEENKLLTASEDGVLTGDRGYSHKIAENVYPESGIKVIKGHMDTLSALAVFANNSGELNYSIYDAFYNTMTAPATVAGSGYQDFHAQLVRGDYSHQTYLVWDRHGASVSGATLSSVASSGDIKLARFDYDEKRFVDYEDVTTGSGLIYGGLGVALRPGLDAVPYVFAYTNPSSDPAGLSENSSHEILVYHKSSSTWIKESLGSYTGKISSFDAGFYEGNGNSLENAVFTLEKNGEKVSYVLGRDNNGKGYELARLNDAWGIQYITDLETPVLVFMRDGALYATYRNSDTDRIFGSSDHKLPEAPFTIIGDPEGTLMVAYLSSVNGSQNIVGYVRANGTENWTPLQVTQVGENANVSFFGGVFLGPNYLPLVAYTVQNYRAWSLGYEDTTADMYAQIGKANNHVSLVAADITNLPDLAVKTNSAEVDLLIHNSGLFNVKSVAIYLKNKGEGDDKYTKLGDYDVGTLRPGEMKNLTITLPEFNYSNPRSFVIGITSRGSEYSAIGIQSDAILDAAEGPLRLAADYNFHTAGHDSYAATVTSLGPGAKNGSVVFYDWANLTVYQTDEIKNLAPGETFEATLDLGDQMLATSVQNLAVRVLGASETLDEAQPTGKYRQTELLPVWYGEYLGRIQNSAFGKDDPVPGVPNTAGASALVADVARASALGALVVASFATYRFLSRRRS